MNLEIIRIIIEKYTTIRFQNSEIRIMLIKQIFALAVCPKILAIPSDSARIFVWKIEFIYDIRTIAVKLDDLASSNSRPNRVLVCGQISNSIR